VAGFVANRPDGRVEAVFEGENADVDAMIDWCRSGTDWAVIDSMEVTEEAPEGATSFDVER
jgi:acylphosphatase